MCSVASILKDSISAKSSGLIKLSFDGTTIIFFL